MTNDTAVFDAMRPDPLDGDKQSEGRLETRAAITRDGLALGVQSRGQVGRIAIEVAWLTSPGFADGLERCEAVKALEPLGEVISVHEGA